MFSHNTTTQYDGFPTEFFKDILASLFSGRWERIWTPKAFNLRGFPGVQKNQGGGPYFTRLFCLHPLTIINLTRIVSDVIK